MSADDQPIAITLTVRQWRGIKAAIGQMWSGPQDVLWDKLDEFDLDDPDCSLLRAAREAGG